MKIEISHFREKHIQQPVKILDLHSNLLKMVFEPDGPCSGMGN